MGVFGRDGSKELRSHHVALIDPSTKGRRSTCGIGLVHQRVRVGYVSSDSEDRHMMANKRRNTDRVGIKSRPRESHPRI
jgi:hypothetical protein